MKRDNDKKKSKVFQCCTDKSEKKHEEREREIRFDI